MSRPITDPLAGAPSRRYGIRYSAEFLIPGGDHHRGAWLIYRRVIFGLVERHAKVGDPTNLCGGHLYWTLPAGVARWGYGPVLHAISSKPGDVEHLTITPSLACRSCASHGWIREGRWVDA